jgi:CRP-like cAMP-binding protein
VEHLADLCTKNPTQEDEGLGGPSGVAHTPFTILDSMSSPHDLDVATELRAIPGFAEVPAEAVNEMVPLVGQRRLLAQMSIVEQGVPSGSWLALVRGAAKTTRTTQTEAGPSVVVLDVMRAPCIVSDPSVFDGAASPASIIALRASHVFAIERRAVLRLLSAYPALSRALLSRLAEDVRALVRRVDEVVSGTVDERVKHLLESLAIRQGTPLGQGRFIAIPLRRRDIACMVNATTETVSRLLAKFEREGRARSTRDGIWWRTSGKSTPVPGAPESEPLAEALPRDQSGRGR